MSQGHTEFFGPDFGRGPFAPHRIETAAVQIATALAQLRAPLSRSDSDIEEHAEFIRGLADRLAPDWAAQVNIDVGTYYAATVSTSIAAVTGTFSLLECWLADASGGGLTGTTPSSVTWTGGAVLQTIVADKHFLVVTPHTGAVNVDVAYGGTHSWYWAVARQGRVYYSSRLYFP